jgi:predicted ferric reductase
MYASILVTVTFYLRKRIGYKTFHAIHYISFIAFAAVLLHSWFAGTDTPLWTTRLMYAFTGLSVVFLTVYRIMLAVLNRTPQRKNISAQLVK